MKLEEIEKLINKRGFVVKATFYTLIQHFANDYAAKLENEIEDYDRNDILAILFYNATIRFIKTIREEFYYYGEILYLSKGNLNRMFSDLYSMTRINYPEKYSQIDFKKLEEEIADNRL